MFHRKMTALCLLAWVAGLTGCSVFQFGEYDSFGEWYVGPPGLNGMAGGSSIPVTIKEDRVPVFGHFRLPELIVQPAGGLRYPDRVTDTNGTWLNALEAQQNAAPGSMYEFEATSIRTDGARDSLYFDWYEAGLVEILPYRTWCSDESAGYKAGITLVTPLNWLGTVAFGILRAPVYVVHDVLKTATIPVAAVYYGAAGDAEE